MSNNARVAKINNPSPTPWSNFPFHIEVFFFFLSKLFFLFLSTSHLLNVNINVCFPCFGEERCPGGEVLLKLGVGVLLAAVAAAGGAAPGHLERGSFVRAASLVCHADYRYNLKNYN